MDRKEREFFEFLDEGLDKSLLEKDELFLKKVNNFKRKGGWKRVVSVAAVILLLLGGLYFSFQLHHSHSKDMVVLNRSGFNPSVEAELKQVSDEVEAEYEVFITLAKLESLEMLVANN